jgi:hypothetical protein
MADPHLYPDPHQAPLPDHLQWKGEGPAPKYWWAKDKAGNTVKVYRSYEDYVDG